MLASQRSTDDFQRFDINYAELVQSRLIGHGRFGRVYEYTCNGTTVAIKDIAVCAEDQNRLKKLLRESKVLKKLDNKNIITLHDTQVKPQNLLLVMELAAGGSVSGALVKYGPLAPNVVANWAAQVAEGMCYLHESDVVHRDLKSSNVLVLEPLDSCLFGKTLKIADFGLACDDYDGTRTMSEPAGTIFWMAPEVREAPHRFSKASDVWSYGVVVWSMFKGKEPSTISYPVSATTEEFGSLYAEILNDCWTTDIKKRPYFSWIVKYLQATTENLKKKLRDEQQEQQKQLDRERRTAEQLQSELKFAAPTKPLSFDSKPLGTFKGPGRCWDVAVTPQGRLLVAAMAEGLKEYDATSFREIATWKPDADLLDQDKNFWVRTVDVLSDGRALVGLNPKQVVLLRRDVVSGGYGSSSSSAAAEGWSVERRVAAELQAPPRHLSAWDDRLLAVLEDRYDDNTKSWCCGPGLVLLSLRDGDKQLHRQRLDYNAFCVALTDRGVIVSSDEQVELTAAGGSSNIKSCVVDCYSHVGVRLWRHESDAWCLRSDSVGRVLYAAQVASVVALSTDDGRELSSALALSTTETKIPYALFLDKGTQRRLVLISIDSDGKPNIITIFSVA